ncbi:expressed unknown protein [Seminavis robusta]|uniref:RxLR effector protein n=1 Tax=Seminavis robusta TaxID=568900 RepID=A0A9N8HFF4_9STRA|nr:expressed unknown protein [Seminavis robusta]|eukprot:Sro347_g122950.1 n/a (119) ;mRNA; r:34955-35414
MKFFAFFLVALIQAVHGFAPLVHPTRTAVATPLFASVEGDEDNATSPMRKRDKVKKVIKNVFGANKETSQAEPTKVIQETMPKRKMMKLSNGKYEKIECLEEKAFTILKDLNMIEETN